MCIITLHLSAQNAVPKFVVTLSGVEPIILKFDALDAEEIYSRTLKWFRTVYHDPNEPSVSGVKNELVKIDGSIENAFIMDVDRQPLVFDIEYALQISVKENQATLAMDIGQVWWHPFNRKAEFTYQRFFTTDGEIRPGYGDARDKLEKSINSIVHEFYHDLKIRADTRTRQTSDTAKVYATLDKNAEPYGGIAEFYKFLLANVQYPEHARRSSVSGNVVFKFVVEPDGSLTNFEIIRSLFKDCDGEIIRVLRICPNWIPGEVKGRKVRQGYTMSFNFKLQ